VRARHAVSASPHSQIIEIDPLSDRRWDAFVKAHPSPRGHHLGGWASILRDCYGYKPKYIALEQGGDLAGVLPLVSSGRRLSGSRLSSLPTAKAAGPLASTHEDERRLLGAAVEITRRERLGAVFVRSEHPGLDHPAAGLAKTYQTQVLALQPPEQLLEQYKRESHNLYR